MLVQNSQTTPNISFQMKVKFAVWDKNNKVAKALDNLPSSAFSDFPYGVRNMAHSTTAVGTKDCNDCNTIGITNGKKVFMFHLIPDELNLEKMKDFSQDAPLKQNVSSSIQRCIDDLKESGGKIEAFIIGGREKENYERRSISLFNGLKKILKSNEIKPTILWGQTQTAGLDAHFSVKANTLTIFTELCQLNEKIVKRLFEIIDFNPNDKAFLPNNRKIDTNNFKKDNLTPNLSEKRLYA